MKMIVEAFEKGLRFRNGRFVEVLEPGRYRVARIFAKEEIRKVDLSPHLRGAERGEAAAERARAAAAAG